MQSKARTILRAHDPLWEDVDENDGDRVPLSRRPLAFNSDFLELLAGAATITDEMSREGMDLLDIRIEQIAR